MRRWAPLPPVLLITSLSWDPYVSQQVTAAHTRFFLFCSTQINPNKHIESDFDLIRPGREMPNALHEFAEKEQKSQFSE